MILRRGTMLDATVIETTASKPPFGDVDAKPIDPDAAFASRPGKSRSKYGYKAHVAVDQHSGLIRKVITTPANVSDTTPADLLICGDERAVLADAAYHTHAREGALKARGIKCRLMRRPNKHHKQLPPRLQKLNNLIARQRSAVETTFATLKRRMGLGLIHYCGQAKAEAQITLAAIAFNMRRWAAIAT
jgi:transposase, IS5 family